VATIAAPLVLALAMATHAEAGFLEDLFGTNDVRPEPRVDAPGRAAPPKAYRPGNRPSTPKGHAPAPGDGFDVRANRERRSADGASWPTRAGRSVARSEPRLCQGESAQRDKLAKRDLILHDPTLRAGDSVVTSDGVRIFAGRRACPHSADDFVPIGARFPLPKNRRDTLLAIEQGMKIDNGSDVLILQATDARVVESR
jgi:hypothetical protein